MITDNIKNSSIYYALNPKFQVAFEFLKNTDLIALQCGKHYLAGDEIYANVEEYETKPQETRKYEAHKKYIDIQYIVSGEEKLGFQNIEDFRETIPYDEARDIAFGEAEGSFVLAKEGDFVIFMPQDAHMPCVMAKTAPVKVKKVVVKIKID